MIGGFNKKGISAVVATVLIILITVAAVTIVWTAIIPLISNKIQEETLCQSAVSSVSIGDVCIGAEKKVEMGSYSLNQKANRDAGVTEIYKGASTDSYSVRYLNNTNITLNGVSAVVEILKGTSKSYSSGQKVTYLNDATVEYLSPTSVELQWIEQRMHLQIKRQVGDFELSDIQLFLKIGDKSTDGIYFLKDLPEEVKPSDIPSENQEREVKFKIPGGLGLIKSGGKIISLIEEISIAPVVKIGNTQKTCEISSKKEILVCSSAYSALL